MGTLAGIGGALIAGAAAALVAGGGLEKAVFYGLFAALFAAPTSAAAAIGFARVDTTLTDACPIDTRRLRMGLATALSAPVVLGVAFLGAGSVMADLGLDGGDQYDSTPRQVDVALEEAVPFALAFPQRITLSRVELDTHGDLVLDLLSADGRVIKSADDPEKLEDFRLDEGEYAFRLRPYTSGGPPTEVQLAEVQLLPAIALIASTFSRGLRLDVQPSASQAQLPSEPDAKLVRVKFISNSLGFTKEEVDQARAAREMLSPGKSAASRPQAGGYALVRDNPQLAFVPGSLVRAVGGGASTDAQGQPYDLVLGWTRSGRRQVLRQEDIAPLDRPSADTLRQMEVFRRVYGEPGESRVETLLGRELTRKDPDRNLVASLERAGAWLAEPDKIEQNFDGNLFLYAGSPERAQVAPGSLLRGIRWKEGSDRVGFELIDGLGRDRGEYAHYWLPGEDAIHIGKTLEASWLDTARRFRDRYPVDASDARWKPVALADPAKLPPEPDDRTDGSFGPLLSADQIRSEAGAWIDEFGVDLASTEAPPMFTHYYIVADQEGTHDGYAGLGSIVQGVTWEGGDRDPLYRVLHGWTEGRNEYYIRARALTYLGPDWDEAWTDPAEELHARQENPATYHNFVDQVAP